MGDQWPEFPLARAVRRPIGAHRDGQSRLCAEPGRARGRHAGARHGARRRHREDGVGVQVQRVSERHPTAPRRLGVASGRSGHRQYLRAWRLRARRRPEQGRQAALGAFGRRRVRRVHDARRSHDVDENLDTSELGMIAAIDGSQNGDIKTTKWAVKGDQFGFSSPVIDGSRVYQIENGSRLKAYDLESGRELWRQSLGTVQKAPLVLADGKLYVGTESGKFFIVRPTADKAEVLSEVELPISTDSAQQQEGTPEPVLAGG